MNEVKLYSAEGAKGDPVYNGSILYDGKTLSSKAASAEYKNTVFFVMNEAIVTPDGDVYSPEEDPEGWFNNLHLAYRSYGLTATRPVQTKGCKARFKAKSSV